MRGAISRAPASWRVGVIASWPDAGVGRGINLSARFDNQSVNSRRPNRAVRANGLLRPGGGMATQGRGTVSYPGSSPGWASKLESSLKSLKILAGLLLYDALLLVNSYGR